MSIASLAIAEPPRDPSGAQAQTAVPPKRRTIATSDAPLVPEAR
jgi:hypothetical protein